MSSEWKKDSEPESGYHLLEDAPFARGGSGEVWKAIGPGGIRVVLKRVPLAGPMGDAERKSLELLRSISGHPHLLGIHGFWVHANELVIATELASGSLADRLRASGGRGLAVDELLEYMEEAAKGIDFLNSPVHQLDGRLVAVQHRDVKPDNLLLVGGSVKLSDFGLAKALEHQATSHTGVMTPAYAAPEAFVHQTTSRSDQYSLAASYVELRTGHAIYSGAVAHVMYGHLHGNPNLAGLSPREVEVVGRALAKNPEERFVSCREFVTALRHAVAAERPALATVVPTASTAAYAHSHASSSSPSSPLSPAAPGSVSGVSNSARTTIAPAAETHPFSAEHAAAPHPHSTMSPARIGFWVGLPVVALVLLAAWTIQRLQDPDRGTPIAAAPPQTIESRSGQASQSATASEPATSESTGTEPTGTEPTEPKANNTPTAPGDSAADSKPAEPQTTAEPEPPSRPTLPPAEPLPDDKKKSDSATKTQRASDLPPPPPSDDTPSIELPDRPGSKAGKAKADAKKPLETARRDAPPASAPPAAEGGDLAEQGYAFLKKFCYRCHGVDFKVPGLNVLDRDYLLAQRGQDEDPYIVAGKPDQSQFWLRVGEDGDMPPTGAKPSDAEKELFKQWIEAGAPFPKPAAAERQFRSDKDVMAAIAEHLRRTPSADRNFQRYFTLTHLHNNKSVRDDELRLYRAALSKMANSVSWKHSIVVPEPIDPPGTIFNVDLRDLGWDEGNLWKEILKVYPYGLKHSQDRDEEMRDLARDVAQLSGSDMAMLRADWFIATAARPPLYHVLLRLPTTTAELERTLKVNAENDFLRNRIARAGFATSGVSAQNRIVDRHDSVYGAYWKSYDFRKSEGTGNIFQFPLGPKFNANPFNRQAFDHAGGELIFALPNGLHGYLLVDENGDRIDEGPIDIVHDELKTSGTPTIVTGVSCMACHKHGIIEFEDSLRLGQAVAGEAREKIELIVPPQTAMNRLVDQDEERYLQALDAATGVYLKDAEDADKNIRQFPEPVGAISRLYLKDMGPEEVACELSIPNPVELQGAIRANMKLRQLGLGPLVGGSKIKREAWETLKNFNSPMQEAARELELGTPYRIF